MLSSIVLLDAGLVGLACLEPGRPSAAAFHGWLQAMLTSKADVYIADLTRYEVRRELVRIGAAAKLRRLDRLCDLLVNAPVTAEAWERAGEFWAAVRRAGRPTASPEALDAAAILAGVAATIGQPGDAVIVATTNVRHLNWFPGVDARAWPDVAPPA